MRNVIPAAIAISVGLITLLGYFFTGVIPVTLRLILTDWAVILGALAVILGLINLIAVHARRIEAQSRGWLYSVLTVAALLVTLLIGVLIDGGNLYAPDGLSNLLFTGVIAASQAALASLVMFFLVVAAVRMLRTKPNAWSILFLAVIVITLVAWLPFEQMGLANAFRDWMISVPAAAGARGIVLGVALGTIAIGLRVLTGVERPYKD
jgi:hypothetical protein